tara:strand:- start:3959 stop:5119 length:1161 start_codon:yes stop_codon:yes gene_type:complete
MANTLTNLAADIYKAADVVGRELVGFIPASTINANGSERAAKGDTVRASFTRAASAVDVAEAMTIPEGTDQTVDNKTLSITNARAVQIPYTGEDMKHLNNGIGFQTVYGDQIKQAMRVLVNEIEEDLAQQAYLNASRAYGTAGTTPFGSTLEDGAQILSILEANGMPTDGQTSLVLGSAAAVNMRKLTQLTKVNEAGDGSLLRQGILGDIFGLNVRQSAKVQSHTKGAGTGYLADLVAGYAVGDTTIHLDTGTVNTTGIKAGDVITFAGDTNKYIVNTGTTAVEADIILNSNGLRATLADNVAATIGNTYVANIAFHRAALELAMRAPAVPEGGDAADDAMTIVDPHSGLVFEIRMYRGYRKSMIEVAASWGVKAWKSDFIATLLG